ncbi:MAG: hypothetical protein JNJ46_09740 [Myxococcales bacterium]|jgi:hypothetical protein|nr:hypothetical protein [Myxococcales bacterium]
MPRHASTCLCEGCERDGTGEFADRDAGALARVVGSDEAALQARLFRKLSQERERTATRRDCTLDLATPGRALAPLQARR